ncbi:ATPase family gene 2 protein homolog B-like isoform X2 [Periplaneta americana]|uniref:ATPase family gene 2 protein homolog B-like isoform X2 n=1 Tax=Periplaneta americana TaxID=6978 RepID=UPI0037E98BFC
MVMMYQFAFWFSTRFGSLVVATLTLIQSITALTFCIVWIENQDKVKDKIGTWLRENDMRFMTGTLHDMERDPESYLVGFIVYLSLHCFACVLLLYGSLKGLIITWNMDENKCKPLIVLPLEDNISMIQKCHLPRSYSDVFNFKTGSYILLRISKVSRCVCKLYWRSDVYNSSCFIDDSVISISDCKRTTFGLPLEAPQRTYNNITVEQVQALPRCVAVKHLSVSLVFESVTCNKRWKEKPAELLDIVKNLLEFFMLVTDSIVYTKNLSNSQKFGIHCIVVHDIGTDVTVGRVVSGTNVHITHKLSKVWLEQFQNSSDKPPLSGLSSAYQTLHEVISHHKLYRQTAEELGINSCSQVLLVGPSGCGKTTLVRNLAANCGAVLVSVLGPEAFQPKPGDTEAWLLNIFQEASDLAEESLGIDSVCILLLDEVDSLCPRRSGGGLTPYQARASTQLLTLLEHIDRVKGLIVIATTNRPNALDPKIRRPGRLETEAKNNLEEWLLDFKASVGRVRPSSLRGGLGVVTTQPSKLSDIGGMKDIKQSLCAAVEWPLLYPEAFARFGLPHPKGVLLYGPPGCAKTSLARALASALNVTFLSISAAELYSPYVGDAEKGIAELFHRARLGAPTILFIDEIDALVGSRGERESGVQERVLSALLTEMDGIGVRLDSLSTVNKGVVVIAATNRPDMLDDALLRPGRFDKLLYVPPPDAEARLDILKILTAHTPLGDCVDLQTIALATNNFSGADLSNLCREAALAALTEGGMAVKQVKHKHFLQVLQHLLPSLSQDQIDFYSCYKK